MGFVKLRFSSPLTCGPVLLLGKIAQILQKVIVFFPEKEEEIKPWFWHIWKAQLLKFFRTNAIFTNFDYLHGKRGVKVRPKMLSFGLSLLHKNSNPSKIFETSFLFARVLPLVRSLAILDYIKESKDQNISQKEPYWMLNRYAKLWKFLT